MALAFFSTWTTYGTWLPGDGRGWYERGRGLRNPDHLRTLEARLLMAEHAVRLGPTQRPTVERTIRNHCALRSWTLHAVNCRSNHVHVVVTAAGRAIEVPREQFKSWCIRELRDTDRRRERWWTERGWDEYVDDEDALASVVAYVIDGQ